MEISGVNANNSVLPVALHLRESTAAAQLSVQKNRLNTAQTAAETNEAQSPIQQNGLFINEILQNLHISSSDQENILLINELSPALEAAEATTKNLNPAQENALQMNAALQGVSAAASPLPRPFLQTTSMAVKGAAATATVSELQNPAGTSEERGLTGPRGTSAEAQGVAPSRTETATTQVATPAAATLPPTVTTIPVPLSTVPEIAQPTPPQMPRPDLTPYVLAAYDVRYPNAIPGSLEPNREEVNPLMPVGRVQAIGGSGLGRAWERGSRRPKNILENIALSPASQAEKSLRFTLRLANEDMTAHGQPLHLVFAKHGEDFAVDVYDCSDNKACRLSYEVPFALNDLPTKLNNLQHETGIIVNEMS